MAIASNGRTSVNEVAKPFTTEERPSLAASQPASARDGIREIRTTHLSIVKGRSSGRQISVGKDGL
jgi:hypothetical protein